MTKRPPQPQHQRRRNVHWQAVAVRNLIQTDRTDAPLADVALPCMAWWQSSYFGFVTAAVVVGVVAVVGTAAVVAAVVVLLLLFLLLRMLYCFLT